MRWMALGWLAMSGCVIPGGPREEEAASSSSGGTSETCTIAATDGGDGGPGGILSIRTARDPQISGTLLANGGEPGSAGQAIVGPLAEPGVAGSAGTIEVLVDGGYAFDRGSVPPGSLVSIGVPGQSDILPEGASIAVDRLQLGPGATLALSRHPSVTVRELHIATGARLVLRDIGATTVALDTDDAFAAPGLGGGTLMLIAERVVVEGTIDLSGNEGGGLGGHLVVRAEELVIDAAGVIRADGGNGIRGLDESSCP